MKIETFLAQVGCRWDEKTGSISMPIYQTATFAHKALGESTGFDYSRSGNPTRQVLEDALAWLDGGTRGFAFSSGMAAIDCVLRLFRPGDKIIVSEDLYGGTFRILEKVYKNYGIDAIYVDASDIEQVRDALNNKAIKAVFVEMPTNPLLKVADIEAINNLCKQSNILLIVDNTFLTPCFFKPLEAGADIVVYSATKYLSGHNDVIAGAVVVKDKELAEKVYFYQNAIGSVLAPQDAWLVLRGLKTLDLRIKQQEKNALQIAKWLQVQKSVSKVYYPGLVDHPGHEILKKHAQGFGSMIAFEVSDPNMIKNILRDVKIFFFAESLGGVESLITFPKQQTHADIDEEIRERIGINDCLLRLSIGIESVEDLLEDLENTLRVE